MIKIDIGEKGKINEFKYTGTSAEVLGDLSVVVGIVIADLAEELKMDKKMVLKAFTVGLLSCTGECKNNEL